MRALAGARAGRLKKRPQGIESRRIEKPPVALSSLQK
jgi:hypothetical protein